MPGSPGDNWCAESCTTPRDKKGAGALEMLEARDPGALMKFDVTGANKAIGRYQAVTPPMSPMSLEKLEAIVNMEFEADAKFEKRSLTPDQLNEFKAFYRTMQACTEQLSSEKDCLSREFNILEVVAGSVAQQKEGCTDQKCRKSKDGSEHCVTCCGMRCTTVVTKPIVIMR